MMVNRVLLTILLLSLGSFANQSQAETRALVMASNYDLIDTNADLYLANPIADADIVAEALQRSGIDSLTMFKEPVAEKWAEAFESFVASLEPDDIALLYYAGHGFQVSGTNYFLSSDGVTLIPLDPMIQKLTEKAKGTIIIVDACRNNPLEKSSGNGAMKIRSIAGDARAIETLNITELKKSGSGLAQIANLRGLSAIVLFSTEPGNVAEDGEEPGKGSLFARAFSREVKRRQSLDEVFRKTAVRVHGKSEGRQSPWRQGDLPFNVFLAGMRSLPIP